MSETPWRTIGRPLRRASTAVLVGLVRCYQWTIAPFLGDCCRFNPSCSHYFIGAVRKHGPISGTLRGLWRICRCNPWTPGGDDPP